MMIATLGIIYAIINAVIKLIIRKIPEPYIPFSATYKLQHIFIEIANIIIPFEMNILVFED
jgi:hypothetical protein